MVGYSQNSLPYPKNYFRSPLDIPIVLSGTFGELRPNHFHSGIDIKTQGKEGIPVYATADGYVSRIKIGQYGYGKTLYVQHPNGYTTVYAHLQKFEPSIENHVKKIQYQKEKYAIGNSFPKPAQFPVKKGQIIAYSGDTGSSGGPHLHYEIRNTKTENIINPLLFGLTPKDTIKPIVQKLMVYPLDPEARINNSATQTTLDLKKMEDGIYTTYRITASGNIGFGISTFDRLNGARNKNGIYSLEMKVNGVRVYFHHVETFSFSESKYINLLIDYEHYKKFKKRLQKTHKVKANKLSLYKNLVNDGKLEIKENADYIIEIIAKDLQENKTTVRIPIKGVKSNTVFQPINCSNFSIIANLFNKFSLKNVSVAFPKNTFYEDLHINFEVTNGIAKIHTPTVPLHKKYTLTFGTSHLSTAQKKQGYIANISNPKYPRYCNTRKKEHKFYTTTKILGDYTLLFDTKKPRIRLINFYNNQTLDKHTKLKVKIKDKESGIKSYRATIDNEWVLMEYNHKKGILTYDFNDKKLIGNKHTFKIIVSDQVGNTKMLKTTFFKQ